VFSVDEAHNKAMKVKRLQSRAIPFKSTAERTSGGIKAPSSSTSSEQPPASKMTDAPPANSATSATPIAKGKENPYTKPVVGKYYRYGEPGQRSNECPKRRQVNKTDYEGEDEVEIVTEPEDSNFAEEYRESDTSVVQQLLCNQKNPDTTQ